DKAAAQLAGAVAARVVPAQPAGDLAAQLRRQRLVGEVHVAKAGVATGGRHFERIERRGARRTGDVRHGGMPGRPVGAKLTDRLAVFDDVRDHHDVLPALRRGVDPALLARDPYLGGGDRRPIQFAELPAEAQEVVIRETLAAEAQHEVLGPGLLDRAD